MAPSRVGWVAIAGAAVLLAASVIQPAQGRAADPVATPSADSSALPATCSERYPADGPAGIDLMLGCVVGELMGHYTGAGANPGAKQPRLSTYALPIAVGTLVIVLLVLTLRVATRSAGRRLAPAAPIAWWACPGCRSLNAAGTVACYACGRGFEEGATELRTDGEPPAPQSFGRRADL